jgi:hypothetical protein
LDESQREIVKAVLPSGEVIWVKIGTARDSGDGGLAQDTGGLADRLRRRSDPAAPLPLTGFTEAVHGIARSVHQGLQSIAPHSVEIEFGLDIEVASGELVSMLADVHATSSIRVTLGWDNPRPARGSGPPVSGPDPAPGTDPASDPDSTASTEPAAGTDPAHPDPAPAPAGTGPAARASGSADDV